MKPTEGEIWLYEFGRVMAASSGKTNYFEQPITPIAERFDEAVRAADAELEIARKEARKR